MENKSIDSVHYFVRGLFRGLPETEDIAEQREELEAHINDRISDSMEHGIPHDEAFSQVVDSLGNLTELIETITGTRKKIYVKKADWFMMAGGIIYGTLYMIAVGLWFASHGFGWSAVYIAVPGWLGFVIPALIKFIDYRRHPGAVAVVPVNMTEEIRSAVVGWACISVVCWIMDFLLFTTDTFMREIIWAWMPTFGLLTWPLMEIGYAWIVHNLKSVEPNSDEQ